MSDLAGFFYPRTATGRSSLLPEPPWHYSGDLLTVEYRTDPARVAELLPAPLEPAPDDPGAVALIWADWQSCGETGQSCSIRSSPSTGRLRRGALQLRRAGRTRAASTSGSMPTSPWPAACTRAIPRSSARSTRPGRTRSAGPRRGSRRAAGSPARSPPPTGAWPRRGSRCARSRQATASSTPIRWRTTGGCPRREGGARPLDELIASGTASVEAGPAWRGEATLELFASPTEELARLEVREIIGGYYRQVGVIWDGGRLLA